MGLENIHNFQGFPIALTGMLIVFAALSFLALFISVLPKLLGVLNEVFPEAPEPKVEAAPVKDELPAELVAAIAFALHKQRAG